MGTRIDRTAPAGGYAGVQTVDDQMSDILNNPRLSENQKREEMEKVFADLPDGEKPALYDRLKSRNSKDPLNHDFHYRLSHHADKPGHVSTVDRLLRALNPNHAAGAGSHPTANGKAPAHGSANASLDHKTIEAILRNRISNEEKKTDFGPEIQVMSQDILKTQSEKTSYAQERLLKAGPNDLKKIMAESEHWPKAARDVLTEAMRTSPAVMQRIAREFSPDQQSKAIARFYENISTTNNPFADSYEKSKRDSAYKAWMDNAPEAALNQALKENKHLELSDPDRGYNAIKNQVNSGNFDNYRKLNPGNQAEILKLAIEDPGMKTSFIEIQAAFRSAKDKNAIIDQFQKENPQLLPDLLKMMPGLNNDLLEGVNKENAEFIRETYLSMADREPSKSLADQFRQRAHFIKGWIEESFKR